MIIKMRRVLAQILTLMLVVLAGSRARAESAVYDWNLSTDPAALLVSPNLSLDYKFTEHWSLGPTIYYTNRMLKAVQINQLSSGLTLTFATSEAHADSWILEASVLTAQLTAQANDAMGTPYTVRITNITSRLVAGYQWYWGHFNLQVSGGQETNSAGHAQILDNNGNSVGTVPFYPWRLMVDGALGWAF